MDSINDSNNTATLEQVLFFANEYELEYYDEGENICYIFPKTDDGSMYSKDSIIFYYDNYENELMPYNQTTIRCKLCSQTLLNARTNYYYPDFDSDCFKGDGYEVHFVQHPFYWALWNTKEHNYNDYIGADGLQYGIEFRYKSTNKILSIEEEYALINKILFFENRKYNICVKIDKIINAYQYSYWHEELQEIHERITNGIYKVSDLPPYSILNEMLIKAMSIDYAEVKYLFYYKMLEHIAPIIAKQKSFIELSTLLESTIDKSINTFLKIYNIISNNQVKAIRDNEIPKLVLMNCVDVFEYINKLPDSILQICKDEAGFSKKDTIDKSDPRYKKFINSLASCLYSTRNNIVHAKYNYTSKGNECPPTDYDSLNEFMDHICLAIITWNDLQENEFKIM